MKTRLASVASLVVAAGLLACGGDQQGAEQAAQQQRAAEQDTAAGEQAAAEQEAAQLTMPDWMSVDEQNQTVTMHIVSGSNSANNNWNYWGYHSGNARIVVPVGYEVTIDFENQDDLSPHSLGIDEQIGDYPPTYQTVEPTFEGALTSGATSMSEATQSGESETITFTASEAGDYAMVCYLPGHAAAGMWIHFRVSDQGNAGLQEQ